MRSLLRTIASGFLMGTADLIPGVSGGTIALVVGIYERLVASIREGSSAIGALLTADLAQFRAHLRNVEWSLLVPLLGGIALAVVLLSSFLEDQLERRPVLLAAVFLGLVAGSVGVAWKLVRAPGFRHILTAAGVGIALFVLLGLGGSSVATAPSLIVFFGSGALAICAMILPGISGSLILVLVGMYAPVLGAVNDRALGNLAVFIGGAIVGLALFSQALHWALARYHDLVLASLIGLMAGSLRILWPWPDGVDSAALGVPSEGVLQAVVGAGIGLIAVLVIARLADSEPA